MKEEWQLEHYFYDEKISMCFKKVYGYYPEGLSKSKHHAKLIEDTVIGFEKEIYTLIPSNRIKITRDEYIFYRLDVILDATKNNHYITFGISEEQSKWEPCLVLPLVRWWYGVDFIRDYKKIAEVFSKIYNSYPAWKSEFETILKEHRKQIKKKELAETSIEVMLKNTFAGSGYKYDLQKNDRNITLQVKLKKKKMLEVRLDHKNFAQQIKSVPGYLEKISKLIDETPLAINIKTYGNNINWQEAK